MIALDGMKTDKSEDDTARTNKIALLLEEWGLLKIMNKKSINMNNVADISTIKIIPFKEKKEWTLKSKYEIGVKKEELTKKVK